LRKSKIEILSTRIFFCQKFTVCRKISAYCRVYFLIHDAVASVTAQCHNSLHRKPQKALLSFLLFARYVTNSAKRNSA